MTLCNACGPSPIVREVETKLPPDPPAEIKRSDPRPGPRPLRDDRDTAKVLTEFARYGDVNAWKIYAWCQWWESQRAVYGKPVEKTDCVEPRTPQRMEFNTRPKEVP